MRLPPAAQMRLRGRRRPRPRPRAPLRGGRGAGAGRGRERGAEVDCTGRNASEGALRRRASSHCRSLPAACPRAAGRAAATQSPGAQARRRAAFGALPRYAAARSSGGVGGFMMASALSPLRTSRATTVANVAQMAQREAERVQLVCLVTLTLIAVRDVAARRARGGAGRGHIAWARARRRRAAPPPRAPRAAGARAAPPRAACRAGGARRAPRPRRARFPLSRRAATVATLARASRPHAAATPPRRAPRRCTGWSP